MLFKATEQGLTQINDFRNIQKLEEQEISLLNKFYDFNDIIKESGEKRNPSIIANYVYDLAKEYNRFYHEIPPILKDENENLKKFRLSLSEKTGLMIKTSLDLLGIEVPERM